MGAEQPDRPDRPVRLEQLAHLAHLAQWGLRGRPVQRVRLVQRGLLALEAESLILQGLTILLLVLVLPSNQ